MADNLGFAHSGSRHGERAGLADAGVKQFSPVSRLAGLVVPWMVLLRSPEPDGVFDWLQIFVSKWVRKS
jgi:hypothetical protein